MQTAHCVSFSRGAALPSLAQRNQLLRRPLHVAAVPHVRRKICSAQKDDQTPSNRAAAVMTAATAIALLLSAGTPDAALAARSGGRVGGSSFRSAPSRSYSSGPSQSSSSSSSSVRTYNYYNTAPPVVAGGYGYGGGMSFMPSFMPTFFFPVYGFGGGIFTFLFAMFVFSSIISAVRSSFGRRDSDDFED